ncbi:hypothetical protein AAJCM20276_37810 (plasmid) [Acetobacter aceti]|uniref:Uncharacterized protein n=1 Tax=Acetobacter aceti TaxID=435 RepID=A0A6S6PJ95_ACEAC|nr:hypothetical protein [Acetobacter aceti]BCI69157.1 hypothetical protein AAJCM20276_37810 [Acetobacter aceti]
MTLVDNEKRRALDSDGIAYAQLRRCAEPRYAVSRYQMMQPTALIRLLSVHRRFEARHEQQLMMRLVIYHAVP